MTSAQRHKARSRGLHVTILFMALFGAGTISNQLRLNSTNARIHEQARAGQLGLNRQCSLLPISERLYADAVRRGVITNADYAQIYETAKLACAAASPVPRQ